MSEDKIISVLKKEGPLRPGDIAERTGIEKGEVSKLIKKLKSEGKIISPKRCYYSVE